MMLLLLLRVLVVAEVVVHPWSYETFELLVGDDVAVVADVVDVVECDCLLQECYLQIHCEIVVVLYDC